MRTKLTSLIVGIVLATISSTAQKTITVEAQNSDISNNLDLQAIASTFGESSDLEDFEKRLNDYDSQLSNLDLNNDGEVDYLRVVENMENDVHVVVIQAVLGKEVFQDVATIIVEKKENRRTVVQVVGDPYLYGPDYIIEPVYVYTPNIFSFFWGYNYHRWYSPYYYGYYPNYYHNRRPCEISFYTSHINSHINHDHRYYYSEHLRGGEYASRLQQSVSRNDYGTRHPERTFSSRNANISNKRDIDNTRGNNTVYDRSSARSNYTRSNSNVNETRGVESRSTRTNRTQDDVYQSRTSRSENQGVRSNSNAQNNERTGRSTQSTTYSTRGTDANRSSQSNTQPQQQRTENTQPRTQPTTRSESSNSRQAPVVSQPSRPAAQSTPTPAATPAGRSQSTSSGSERTSSGSSSGRR